MPVDIPLRWLTTFLMLVFPAATLFVNRGDSYTLGLLSLIGVWVWIRDGARPWLDRHSGTLWFVCTLFFAVAVLSYIFGLQTEDGFHFLGRYLRFLFIAPAYLAFRRYPPTAKTAFTGLALGALVSGVLAMLLFMHAHTPIRVQATTELSIIFGDLATTMVLCTVAGFGLMAASRRVWSVPLLILCLAGGVAATLLSGTRGAWIPLLLLPLALMTPLSGFLKRRYIFAIVLVLVAVFSSFYFMARSGTQIRLTDVRNSVRNYFVALHHMNTPIGGFDGRSICKNDEEFLKAWVQSGRSVWGSPEVEVVADPHLGHIAGCTADYAVRLHNHSADQVTQYIFPRLPDPSASEQHTKLLVRGEGKVIFLEGKEVGRISTSTYQYIALSDYKVPGQTVMVYITVFVSPDKTVWLVPLDSYFGEYSLSIANTSLGGRFEMWRSAWHLFLDHPLLGVGTGAFQENTLQLVHARVIAPFAGIYDHPHNDYLNALSSCGIIGFTALLALLLLPAWFFIRAVHSAERVTHALGLAGALTVAGFAIYALTDTVFLHSMMITWYVIYLALFYALIQTQAKKENGETR
ncbi:MAG: O-antigen ligase family protein [Gammaproteobacteria bacterium]